MTQDVIALTPTMPDARTMLAALYAGGPDLRVGSSSEGTVIQLCTKGGQTVATVEVPVLVQVPGEVRRLLGREAGAEAPVWWTEVRATATVAEAGRLAAPAPFTRITAREHGMRRWRKLIIDTWGALAYKPAFQQAAEGRPAGLPGPTASSWVPKADRRRLAAYTVLASYDSNQAAGLLGEDGDDRREYGDAALIVDQTLSHLLGGDPADRGRRPGGQRDHS